MSCSNDWNAVKERYDAWWEGRLDRGPILKVFVPARVGPPAAPEDTPYAVDPQWFEDAQWEALKYGMAPSPLYVGLDNATPASDLKRYWTDIPSRLQLYRRCVSRANLYGDAFRLFFPDFGSTMVASFLNDREEPHYGNRSIVNDYSTPLGSLQEVEALLKKPPPSRWWGFCQDFIIQALNCLGPNVAIAFPNLGGALDILASLRGTQQMLMDLVLEPEMVKRVEMAISHVWRRCYEDLYRLLTHAGQQGTTSWVGMWSSKRSFPIQCDIAVMISPDMFQEFAVPSLRLQAGALEHCIFHFHHEGSRSRPILDHLLDMEEVQAIQWSIGVEDPPDGDPSWLPIYRRITERGKGLELLNVPPERVGWLVDNLPAGRLAMNVVCESGDQAQDILSRYYHT